jgi:2-polyprenyl-6-methoxyphenol hydroxylase-like FAD-dependent oxidoreductase
VAAIHQVVLGNSTNEGLTLAYDADFDVIIVGARVAGSILATLLGEVGRRVLLLDRARFPSDTLSTHFFRAPTLRALKQIGVYEEVSAVAPHLRVNYNVVDGIVFPEPVDRPDDFPFYMCVRRITLDEILVRRARAVSGVELREAATAIRLIRDRDRVSGVAWKEAGGTGEVRARVVVGADGVHSFVAKEAGASAESTEPVHRAMYYAYFRGVAHAEGPAAEFHYRGNSLVYCFPCDGELTLLASSVPIALFGEFKRSPEQKFFDEIRSMSALVPRLSKAECEGDVRGTGTIPGYLRVPYGMGWAVVGDAGMIMDPWSGQGMDQASTHATILARRLNEYLDEKTDWQTAMQAYHRERNEFSVNTYHRTCRFAPDLRPMTREALHRRGLV